MPSSEEVSLSRIEAKVDRLMESTTTIRERLASTESWRNTHTQAHEDRVKQEHWTTGLLVTVALSTVTTLAVVLLH